MKINVNLQKVCLFVTVRQQRRTLIFALQESQFAARALLTFHSFEQIDPGNYVRDNQRERAVRLLPRVEGVKKICNLFDLCCDELDVFAVGPVLLDLPLNVALNMRHGRILNGYPV